VNHFGFSILDFGLEHRDVGDFGILSAGPLLDSGFGKRPELAREHKPMSKKTTRISLGFDPTIENLKAAPQTKIQNREGWSRREFLSTAALGGTGALLGLQSNSLAAEPPLETTRLRLMRSAPICQAPQYASEELLRSEGFSDVQEVKKEGNITARIQALTSGEGDIVSTYVAPLITRIDAGDPIVILTGLHAGCFELFGTDRIRAIRDLKGKTVTVTEMGGAAHLHLASILSYVGLNPGKDVHFVTHSAAEGIRLLAEGKIDAYMAFPPDPQELRTKKIGHAILNSALDRPWSQYFCCMVAANREFVRKNPVATKRALRAILKTANICALEPEPIARFLVDKGYTKNYEYALQTLKDIPYGKWREFDPEDTVRFYALRLKEIGMIKNGPQKIIAQGTDWRFLKELKKELKA
jgi:NitT/TauT family transport system substrate-binding protein